MVITDPEVLFDAETLRRYESASLLARKVVRGRLRAERRSYQRGASVEFAEYRPFVSGDDWRYIDWHAFARWRQLVLKLFVEEEDLHIHLLLDCSRSMDWGSAVKFDQARRVVGGLAYIALANLDRAAIVPLGADGVRPVPPSRGRERFTHLLNYLAACPVGADPCRLESSVSAWLSSRPRRGLVLWVGDLFGVHGEDALRALDRIRHARHDIGLIQVLDGSETVPPVPGEYDLEDYETGRQRRVVVDTAQATAFRRRVEAFFQSLDRYASKHRIAFLRTPSAGDVGEVLAATLNWR